MNLQMKELFERDIEDLDPQVPSDLFGVHPFKSIDKGNTSIPGYLDIEGVRIPLRVHFDELDKEVRTPLSKSFFELLLEPTQENARTYILDTIKQVKEEYLKWKDEGKDMWGFKMYYALDLEKLNQDIIPTKEDLSALLNEVAEIRDNLLIPFWRNLAKRAVDEYGIKFLRKEVPFALFSLDVQDKQFLRCNPNEAGGESGYFFSSRLSWAGSGEGKEFLENEINPLNDVNNIDIAIDPGLHSRSFRYGIFHDGVHRGSVYLGGNFRAPYDVVHYIYNHLYEELKVNPILVGRGVLYEGLNEDGGKVRVAFVGTHGDQKIIREKPNLIEALKRTKREYNLNFFGLLVEEIKDDYAKLYPGRKHDLDVYTSFEVEDANPSNPWGITVRVIDIEEL